MTDAGVRVGLATDVGGGTSMSMLRTMSEGYKILHLQGQSLPASRALYLATLGAAEALFSLCSIPLHPASPHDAPHRPSRSTSCYSP